MVIVLYSKTKVKARLGINASFFHLSASVSGCLTFFSGQNIIKAYYFMEEYKRMSSFSGATLLITGGTGSFGSTVLKHFLRSDIGQIRIFPAMKKAGRHAARAGGSL